MIILRLIFILLFIIIYWILLENNDKFTQKDLDLLNIVYNQKGKNEHILNFTNINYSIDKKNKEFLKKSKQKENLNSTKKWKKSKRILINYIEYLGSNNLKISKPHKRMIFNTNLSNSITLNVKKKINKETSNFKYLEEQKELNFFSDHENTKPYFACHDNSTCNYHGKCYNNSICICDPYFTTYSKKGSMRFNFTQCNYRQLGVKNIFLLSFFLGPFSFEHFVMGNYLKGISKLIVPMILILIGTSVFILGKIKNSSNLQIIGKSLELLATLIIIFWWLIDWILILCGYYKDNRNVDLYNDFI